MHESKSRDKTLGYLRDRNPDLELEDLLALYDGTRSDLIELAIVLYDICRRDEKVDDKRRESFNSFVL